MSRTEKNVKSKQKIKKGYSISDSEVFNCPPVPLSICPSEQILRKEQKPKYFGSSVWPKFILSLSQDLSHTTRSWRAMSIHGYVSVEQRGVVVNRRCFSANLFIFLNPQCFSDWGRLYSCSFCMYPGLLHACPRPPCMALIRQVKLWIQSRSGRRARWALSIWIIMSDGSSNFSLSRSSTESLPRSLPSPRRFLYFPVWSNPLDPLALHLAAFEVSASKSSHLCYFGFSFWLPKYFPRPHRFFDLICLPNLLPNFSKPFCVVLSKISQFFEDHFQVQWPLRAFLFISMAAANATWKSTVAVVFVL